jgi:hypothetical protein
MAEFEFRPAPARNVAGVERNRMIDVERGVCGEARESLARTGGGKAKHA